jgi:sugar/nucleoside kinase (ribokinase family)
VKGERILGGSAVHFSNAASILTKDIHLVGVVGDDFETRHEDFLRKKGVDLAGLEHSRGKTFHWEGYYEKDMNQAFTVKTELNVFQSFNPVIPEQYRKDRFLFLANIDPDLQLSVLDQMVRPELVVCDTMNYWIDTKKERLLEVLNRSDIAVLNEGEIRQLTGILNTLDAARRLVTLGLKYVIVKRGEYGFLLIGRDDLFAGAAMVLNDVKDPTGAGDSFAGGFVSYVASKRRSDFPVLRKAVIWANLTASFNVQGLGLDGLDRVTPAVVRRRFREYKKLTEFGRI